MKPCIHRDWKSSINGLPFCNQPSIDRWVSKLHCNHCSLAQAPDCPIVIPGCAEGLVRRFLRSPRIDCRDRGTGILTACDEPFFPGLQLLIFSIVLSHDIPICIIDLGMTKTQAEWCLDAGAMIIDLQAIGGASPMDQSVPYWQTWNKPSYFRASPFDRSIWIDADTMVMGDLRELIDILDKGPLLLGDESIETPEIAWNLDKLYQQFPVPARIYNGLPNAGVLGLAKGRDDELLASWEYIILKAKEIPEVRNQLAWWDQGGLAWAIEMLRIRRIPRLDWNTMMATTVATNSPAEFLQWSESLSMPLIHFAGVGKPWRFWEGDLPIHFETSIEKQLTVFILGHNQECFANVPKRSYFRLTNLMALEIGCFRSDQLAESAIYLSTFLDDCQTDYVGLASSSWDRKYVSPAFPGRIRLGEFNFLESHLSPSVVLAAAPSSQFWADESAEYHRGMGSILAELAGEFGLRLKGRSLWSNNYICHKRVINSFLPFWRSAFTYIYARWGFNPPYSTEHYDSKRHCGYLLERVTMLWFANQKDLEIRPLTYEALWGKSK